MLNVSNLIEKAKRSRFYLGLLNFALSWIVPFNRPHGLRISELSDQHVRIVLPYRRSNFNHIKGLHAAALATLAEYTSGFMLLSRLDLKDYRLILQRLNVEYHYQGKHDAIADFEISDDWFAEQISMPLERERVAVIDCEVTIFDVRGNLLATGIATWQIKAWAVVKTTVV